MKNKYALIIIAKRPEKGKVKTRLNSAMTDEKSLELYTYLLENTVIKLKSIPEIDTFIAHAPEDSDSYFSKFGIKLIPLPKGDLGQRMFYAFKNVLSSGYQKAVLVGTDIPDLTGSTILQAIKALTHSDIVFGPAQDGGYYLVGIKKPIKEIFEDVPWSSKHTLEKSIERAKYHNYKVDFTEELSDIDTIEDVKKTGFW